jgi:CRISPR/Cas system-associated protein endoribonuclease Cas2
MFLFLLLLLVLLWFVVITISIFIKILKTRDSHDNSVSKVTDYGPENRGSIPG